ncbi:MAG TPA: hypothetical protein VIL00_02360 [Pseudonocardiaceae bacterium]
MSVAIRRMLAAAALALAGLLTAVPAVGASTPQNPTADGVEWPYGPGAQSDGVEWPYGVEWPDDTTQSNGVEWPYVGGGN